MNRVASNANFPNQLGRDLLLERAKDLLLEIDDFMSIPRKLLVDLVKTENGLASLSGLPATNRPIVKKCASQIRQIAEQAGVSIASTSLQGMKKSIFTPLFT